MSEIQPSAFGCALDCKHADGAHGLAVANGWMVHEVSLDEGFESRVFVDLLCATTRRAALREENAVGADRGRHGGPHVLAGATCDCRNCRPVWIIWIRRDHRGTDAHECSRSNTTAMLHTDPARRSTTCNVAVNVNSDGANRIGDRVWSRVRRNRSVLVALG